MPAKLNPEEFKRWNEEMAKRYDVDLFHQHPSPLVRFIENRRVAQVLHLLKPEANDKILEVGCGAGHVLEKIPAGTLHGVDLSEILLERAKMRLGSRAKLELANAEKLPYADQTFDKIYCSEVLEHVQNPEIALREMARVGKKGATIIVSVPFERNINFGKDLFKNLGLFNLLLNRDKEGYKMSERMDEGWHLHAFSLNLLRGFVPKNLQENAIKRIPFRLFPIHYVVRYRLD